MKASFLGHGLDTGDKNNVGKQLVASLESKKYKIFNGFVAFASISGVKMLEPYLKKVKSHYDHIRFFIGVDNRGTSKEALESLLNQGIETYIYFDERNYVTYHPKLFLFEGPTFSRVIIGSSNLTSSGIKTNLEASVQLDFRSKTGKQGIKFINEIKEYYSELLDLSSAKLRLLTKELLQELIKKNLLFNQFGEQGKVKEPKNNDGENQQAGQTNIEVTDYDIETGFEQDDTSSSDRDTKKTFGKNDYDKFETLIERYVQYKKNVRPSGMVSKHTEDRELFYWYLKMHAIYRHGADSFPHDIFQKLLEVDFPFDGIGRKRKRLIKWNKDFQKVVEYKKKVDPKSDYTYVPQFKDKNNKYYEVGRWCAHQKQRRKGNKNYGADWTQFEEERMESINFLWDSSGINSRPKDDSWTDSLVLLEEYYSKKKNYKSVPPQSTYIGHWLNDQMTLKLRQDRENITNLISEIREEMLGTLLAKNGVEWEWEKQKHRESIEDKISSWRFVEELKNTNKIKEFREKSPKILKKHRDNVAQLRSQSKKWHNEKNRWKLRLLDKAEFPYEKQKKPAPNNA
ncbi:hypothetical protein GH721_13855 [Kriegella sp. EG-1]|nr:hypothetical protein [Flavobacteriaceae bacterium EG-1]